MALVDADRLSTRSWNRYDLLDNGGVPSTEWIVDAYQHLEIGDEVPFTPDGNRGFPVAAIEPGKALVLGGTMNTSTGRLGRCQRSQSGGVRQQDHHIVPL
jgi:hypothetical protein